MKHTDEETQQDKSQAESQGKAKKPRNHLKLNRQYGSDLAYRLPR